MREDHALGSEARDGERPAERDEAPDERAGRHLLDHRLVTAPAQILQGVRGEDARVDDLDGAGVENGFLKSSK